MTIVPQATAGTGNLTLPNTAGTFAVGATGPLVLSATTGGLTCPTCLTTTSSFANPTASVGLSAVNGVAITAMRSDGAPALSQAISPTWTGVHKFNNDVLIADGRPWCDVRAKGAVGDGTTDDTAAFNACVTTIEGFGGGTILVPPSSSVYCLFSGVNFDTGSTINGDIQFIGTGVRYSSLSTCGHNVTVVRMNNQFMAMKNLAIYGYGMSVGGAGDTFGAATLPVVSLASGCSFCRLEHLYIAGGTQALQVQANGATIEDVQAQFSYGDGANGNAILYVLNSGSWYNNSHFDQVWPQAQPAYGTALPARANTTAYGLGAIVTVTCSARSWVWQATVAGTTAGAQPACKNYSQNITDGSVTWQLAGPRTYYAVQIDTGSNENYFSHVDMTGSFSAGFALTNTFAGNAPQSTSIAESTVGGTIDNGILANDGQGLSISATEVSRCVLTSCSAVITFANWLGPTTITGLRVVNTVGYGLNHGVGNQLVISNSLIATAAISAITINANINSFSIINNSLGSSSFGINGNAITVAAGTSDYYNIIGNNINGASTGIVDGGTGTHKIVGGNEGPWTVASGGTGLVAGTSGGIPYFNSTSTMASSGLLAANGVLYGGGAGASPASTAAGTNGQLFLGVTSGAPKWGTMSGDATITNAGVMTLASTITAGGPTGSATVAPIITYDAKGRLTTVSSATITPAVGNVTGLGTGVATALGTNVGTGGSFVVNGGALGSPLSAGTIPAYTLGGTIAGAGNQINNVVIGASTPLAANFTTVGTTGAVSVTNNQAAITTGLSVTNTNSSASAAAQDIFATTDAGAFTLSAASNNGGGYALFSWTGSGGTFFDNRNATGAMTFRTGATPTASLTLAANQDATLSAQIFMPSITTTSAAQTGTVCWTTGTGKFTVDTTVACLTSLLSAKNITERISPTKALDLVNQLSPFAFRYKQGWGDSGRYEQFGLGAEEVAKVDERLVGRDPEGALQGVRYQEMSAVLVGAIQKLKADNDNFERRLEQLENARASR